MSRAQTSTETHAAAGSGRDRLPVPLWLAAGVAIGAGTWIGIASTTPADEDVMAIVNRWLVRAGLPLFWLAFAAAPVAKLWPSPATRRLVRERRGIGVCWATIHLTHAAAIMSTWRGEAGEVPPLADVAIGGLGFVLTALMWATSNDASQRVLGRGWRVLHRTGLWYLTFIYVASYTGNLANEPTLWKAIALATFVGLAGLRAFVWWRGRRRAAAGAMATASG